MHYNYAAESFHTNKLCSRLSSRKAQSFIWKTKKIAFEAPFWRLGARYAVHLRLIGKLVVDFLLVIIELFFVRCFCFVTVHAFDGQTDRQMLIGRPRLHSCSAVTNLLRLRVLDPAVKFILPHTNALT